MFTLFLHSVWPYGRVMCLCCMYVLVVENIAMLCRHFDYMIQLLKLFWLRYVHFICCCSWLLFMFYTFYLQFIVLCDVCIYLQKTCFCKLFTNVWGIFVIAVMCSRPANKRVGMGDFFFRLNFSFNYYNRFMTLCLGLPRWVGTRRINYSGFCWSRDDGLAVASAEPHASYLHLAPEDNHASTSIIGQAAGSE